MNLNAIVFPSKRSSYTIESLKGKLIWIPKIQYNHPQIKKPHQSIIQASVKIRQNINSKPNHKLIFCNKKRNKKFDYTKFQRKRRNGMHRNFKNLKKKKKNFQCVFKQSKIVKQKKTNVKKQKVKEDDFNEMEIPEEKIYIKHKMFEINKSHRRASLNVFRHRVQIPGTVSSGKKNIKKGKMHRKNYSQEIETEANINKFQTRIQLKNPFKQQTSENVSQNGNGPYITNSTDSTKFTVQKMLSKIISDNSKRKSTKRSHQSNLYVQNKPIYANLKLSGKQTNLNRPKKLIKTPQKSSSKQKNHKFYFKCETNENFSDHMREYRSKKDSLSIEENIKKHRVRSFSNNIDRKRQHKAPTRKSRVLSSSCNKRQKQIRKPVNIYSHQQTDIQPSFQISHHIPCLFMKAFRPTLNSLIFFHGNAEDINESKQMLSFIQKYININIFAQEYPTYGIYKGRISEKRLREDAQGVYQFLKRELNIPEERIIILGRSIGSGPATWLASQTNPAMLILMAAFTSLQEMAKDWIGVTGRFLIKNRFQNIKHIAKIKSPVFLIHGQKDKVIKYQHSQRLQGFLIKNSICVNNFFISCLSITM